MKKQINRLKLNGFSILEVVIGIFIFVVGMLALAALQGALTRSMADAKLRTTAVNLADRALERQRGFTRISSTVPPGEPFAYNDITSTDVDTDPINGVIYNIDMNVIDYYYDLASDTFATTGTPPSNYKQVDVTVSWDAVQDFRGGEGEEIASGDLNTGSVTLTSVIPAVITSASGRVSDELDSGKLDHAVTYNPGSNPDVVALDLGGSKFKESLLPEPDVLRTNELVQTTFDVITYSTSDDGSQFLRREEFASVSCECTLRAESDTHPGARPVIWAGDEYMAGHDVVKPYGESASNKNSSLCDTCCQDHHDGGTSTEDSNDDYSNVYGPFRGDDEYLVPGQARKTSDHKHYKEDGVTIAAVGETYLEACRLVRVDGFFRAAQDFRREDQYIFPADFLDGSDDTEAATYSKYVTDAAVAYRDNVVNGYPTNSPPCIGIPQPPIDGNPVCVEVPTMQGSYPTAIVSGQLPTWTALQTGVTDTQQLRSRGIYIDYMSNDLRLFMQQCFDISGDVKNDCCIRNGVVADSCTTDDLYLDKIPTASKLEILPFYEVQLTKLDNWEQTQRDPLTIELTSEAIEDANAHDRGNASQYADKKNDPVILGATDVTAESHRGNIGFTDTLAIDEEFDNQLKHAILQVQSLDASGNGSTNTGSPIIRLEGRFSETVSGSPTINVVGGGDAHCGLKPGGYWCNVATNTVEPPTIMVYGYEDTHILVTGLDPPDIKEIRCAVSGSLIRTLSNTAPDDTNATFSLLDSSDVILPAGTAYDIMIEEC